ncbi:MAG: FliG C-terminal domain-containing protein [Pseudomonadota bacterium]
MSGDLAPLSDAAIERPDTRADEKRKDALEPKNIVARDRLFDSGSSALLPVERAAVVLMSLGPETAARLLSDFGSDTIRRFAKAVNRMRMIPAPVVDSVISDFVATLKDRKTLRGGPGEVRRFLVEVLEREQVDQIVQEIDENNRSVWAQLNDIEDARIATLLKIEHPQVAAFALTRLSAVKAARVLEHLDSSLARSIVIRMTDAVSVDPDMANRIGEVISREFLSTEKRTRNTKKPADLVAGVMNHVSSVIREDLLEHFEETNPTLAKSVRRVMFTFNNIPDRVRPRDVSAIVKAVDQPVLLRSLKVGGPVAAFIVGNLSKRMAERLDEEVLELAEVSKREIEAAKTELTASIQSMVQRGEIQFRELEPMDDASV